MRYRTHNTSRHIAPLAALKNGGTAAWNRKNGEPMNSCITCKEAIEHCMSTHTFAFAHLYGDEKIMDSTFTTAAKSITRFPAENSF